VKRPRGASSTVSTHSLWIVPPTDPRPAVCGVGEGFVVAGGGARGRRLLRARVRGFWSCGNLVSRETCGLESAGSLAFLARCFSSWPGCFLGPAASLDPIASWSPLPAFWPTQRAGGGVLRCFRVQDNDRGTCRVPSRCSPADFGFRGQAMTRRLRLAVRPPGLMSTPMQWDRGVDAYGLPASANDRLGAPSGLTAGWRSRWVWSRDVDARETSSSSARLLVGS
jgi:hypothetical protein